MDDNSHAPLGGLDPADLLRQGAAEDTLVDDGSRPFVPPLVEELVPLFPQFEILDLIGKGGMGAVYKARQKDLDRIVALKILPPSIGGSPEFSGRFTREAKALAKLNHPGIVTIHEFGQRDGLYFIVMEFVDGVNLAQLLKTGRVSPREALAIVPQICDALQYAHDQGIVHRDIKPENILLDRLGRVKVADFGIAKMIVSTEVHETATAQPEATIAGIGTPQYMAPEQVEHPADVDHRADIYALGVVFYQMLTGELPGKDLQAPSRKVHIDVRLDEIVLQAMEKNPELRFQQASVLKTRVETIAMAPPTSGESGVEGQSDWEPPTSGWGWFIGRLFGTTYTSRLAYRLANASALGFLCFLGFVPLPGWRACFAFSAFFGLIGAAQFVEIITRHSPPGAKPLQAPALGLFASGLLQWITCLSLIIFALPAIGREGGAPGGYAAVVFMAALSLAAAVVVLSGAGAMLKTRRFGLAMMASVVAIFAGPAAILGLPFGIWALMVLNRREVRKVFETDSPDRAAGNTGSVGRIVAIGCGVIGSIGVLLMVALGTVFWLFTIKKHEAVERQAQAVASHTRELARAAQARKGQTEASMLTEPPQLRFLAWQDEWKTDESGAARHPDDSPVTDAAELQWLRRLQPFGCDVTALKLRPEPRFLHLWFSHPLFDWTSLNEVVLLDERGVEIPLGARGNAASGSQAADESNGRVGWLTKTISPGARTNLPTRATVRLRYTVGPLERTQEVEVSPGSHVSMSLEGGSRLNGIGQTAGGKAFVALAVDATGMASRRFGVMAVTKDGRTLAASGGNSSGNSDGTGIRVEEYNFDVPLSDVARFIIGSRPVRTMEWKDVALPGNTKLMQASQPVVAPATPRDGVYFTYTGYMTTVLELKGGRFRYWFESDVKEPDEPEYPLSGLYRVNTDTISLQHEHCGQPVWTFRSMDGQLTLWRPDALAIPERDRQWDMKMLKRYGDGSILIASDQAAEELWERRGPPSTADDAKPATSRDQIAVEDLALQMIVAIREKDDAKLRALAGDRIKGWPDALPQFAVELREHYRQSTGNEAFDLRAGESLVEGDLAAVRCTGPKALEGKCLVLFFIKTADGWRNHSLRTSMENVPLAEAMAGLKMEIQHKDDATSQTPKGGDDSILAKQPPVVVETFPVSGARDVPSGETEIRVRFSKPMLDGSWSWSSAWENSVPESLGQPHYEADGQTCVLKARLDPGKTYAFWLNSQKFQNFRDRGKRPAVPYLLIFQTRQK